MVISANPLKLERMLQLGAQVVLAGRDFDAAKEAARAHAEQCGHRFIERDGRWEIEVRQVNLIDCDQNLRNPSIVI